MGVIRILDSSGDTTFAWDAALEETVAEAERLFNRLIAERKLAFARGTETSALAAEQIRSFDVRADEIIFVRPLQGG
jgi:hypothetical protein